GEMQKNGKRHQKGRHHDERKRGDELVWAVEGEELKRRRSSQEARSYRNGEVSDAEQVPRKNGTAAVLRVAGIGKRRHRGQEPYCDVSNSRRPGKQAWELVGRVKD